MLKRLILLLLLVALPLTACAADEAVDGYRQISPEEAQALLDSADPPLLLDVRTEAEYLEGHIPGAICVPNETIGEARPEALPDPARTILVYCRSGRRSREAAEKLIQTDPELKEKEHAPLKRRVRHMFEENPEIFN